MRESDHRDNFERFLRQQVSEHRMYPSDYIWKNIRRKIHTPKKWPALSVFTVLIIAALVIGTVLNKPVPDTVTANFHFSLQSPANVAAVKNNTTKNNNQVAVADDHYSADQLTSNTITEAIEKIKIDNAVAQQLLTATINEKAIAVTATAAEAETINKISVSKNIESPELSDKAEVNAAPSSLSNINYYLFDITSRLKSILNTNPSQVRSGSFAFFHPKKSAVTDNDFDFQVNAENTDLFPNPLQQLSKNSSRFDFRFYVTPSISYRHLYEQKQNPKEINTVSLESSYNVNPSQAIRQSPAIGYETGFGLGYHLNNKFTLTGGFQFNISQYKIDAFLYRDEPVALTLDDGKFLNTISAVSTLRSVAGTKPLTIKNRYYQISMPVGIEWTMLDNSKLSWSLAGSLQPTYTFDKQPLIISSNFKNYTDGSAYVRNLNFNTSLETFLGYRTGSYRWQIGPQIRYQLLPSLVDKYPNKEYLINYGLKIGVVKQLH